MLDIKQMTRQRAEGSREQAKLDHERALFHNYKVDLMQRGQLPPEATSSDLRLSEVVTAYAGEQVEENQRKLRERKIGKRKCLIKHVQTV